MPGKVSGGRRGAPSAGVRRGPRAPTPAAPLRPRLRPPAASASRSASARSAGSPAGLRECPARVGRGPGRRVVQGPGAGAGVAEELRGRERGPGAVPPQSLKFLAGVSRPPLRKPSNGPRAAGPGRARPDPGWEGLGRPCAGPAGSVRARGWVAPLQRALAPRRGLEGSKRAGRLFWAVSTWSGGARYSS